MIKNNNNQKIKNRKLFCYRPCSGGKMFLSSLKKEYDSGTEGVFSGSFARGVGADILEIFQSSNFAIYDEYVYENETNDSQNKTGYEPSRKKREIISNMIQINSSNIESISSASADPCDLGPVKIAKSLGVPLYAKDFDEVTYAFANSVPFNFLLQKEDIDTINKKGFKFFKEKFIKRLNI